MSGRAAESLDFFALLFIVVCMQAMHTLPPASGAAWVVVSTVLMAIPLLASYGLSAGDRIPAPVRRAPASCSGLVHVRRPASVPAIRAHERSAGERTAGGQPASVGDRPGA